jgi:Gamma-glutamyltranspeptidase
LSASARSTGRKRRAPRIHHQWLPDEVMAERGFSPDTIRLLEVLGHSVGVGNTSGSAHSIMRTQEGWAGASDTRRAKACPGLDPGWTPVRRKTCDTHLRISCELLAGVAAE